MKPAGKEKSLPPWLQKAKGEGAKEAKTGKSGSKAHEKGESKQFEKAEMGGKKAPPFQKGGVKKYADGGSVKKDDVGFLEKISTKVKSAFTPEGKPTITGGFADTIKRREERMEAVERGEPDPGQARKDEPVKKADGGKIKKVPSNATKPKATAKNLPNSAGNAKGNTLHLKNGGRVRGF